MFIKAIIATNHDECEHDFRFHELLLSADCGWVLYDNCEAQIVVDFRIHDDCEHDFRFRSKSIMSIQGVEFPVQISPLLENDQSCSAKQKKRT